MLEWNKKRLIENIQKDHSCTFENKKHYYRTHRWTPSEGKSSYGIWPGEPIKVKTAILNTKGKNKTYILHNNLYTITTYTMYKLYLDKIGSTFITYHPTFKANLRVTTSYWQYVVSSFFLTISINLQSNRLRISEIIWDKLM